MKLNSIKELISISAKWYVLLLISGLEWNLFPELEHFMGILV